MNTLPPELVRIIVKNVANDPSTLCSLALTSKHLNVEATRLLYANIMGGEPKRHHKFFQTLQMNPALAVHVRVYHCPQWCSLPQVRLWDVVRAGLKLMVNLKELIIYINGLLTDFNGILPILDDDEHPPFQLETFMCLSPRADRKVPDHLERFVGSQRSLIHLVWMPEYIIPDKLPDTLRSIGGPSTIVSEVLKKKPTIREVVWRAEPLFTLFPQYDPLYKTEAFRHLRLLRIESSAQHRILQIIRDQDIEPFTSLEVLILQNLHKLDKPDLLRSFPNLSEIIIDTPPSKHYAFEKQQAIIATLFDNYNNLHEVDVPIDVIGKATNHNLKFRRWVKGRLLDGSHTLVPFGNLLKY